MTTTEMRPGMPAGAKDIANDIADRFRWSTLLVVLTGTFMTTLDFFILNVAIPATQKDRAEYPHAFGASLKILIGVAVAAAGLLQLNRE